MKKILLALMAALLAVCVISACKKQSSGGITLQPGVLSIGMEIGYPPMEYFDDNQNPVGFDVEMGKAVAAKMGLKAEFVDTAWDGIFAGVETSKYDCIMSSVTITDARKQAHNFSKPYIGNAMAIVSLKSSPIKPKSPQELAGLGVSYQAETTAKFFMEKLVEETGLTYTRYEYDKVISCFDELVLNRVDVIVTDSLVALEYISIPDGPFEVTWQGEADEVFGICIKKGNDALTEAIDKALDELFADGTMLRISRDRLYGLDMVSSAR